MDKMPEMLLDVQLNRSDLKYMWVEPNKERHKAQKALDKELASLVRKRKARRSLVDSDEYKNHKRDERLDKIVADFNDKYPAHAKASFNVKDHKRGAGGYSSDSSDSSDSTSDSSDSSDSSDYNTSNGLLEDAKVTTFKVPSNVRAHKKEDRNDRTTVRSEYSSEVGSDYELSKAQLVKKDEGNQAQPSTQQRQRMHHAILPPQEFPPAYLGSVPDWKDHQWIGGMRDPDMRMFATQIWNSFQYLGSLADEARRKNLLMEQRLEDLHQEYLVLHESVCQSTEKS